MRLSSLVRQRETLTSARAGVSSVEEKGTSLDDSDADLTRGRTARVVLLRSGRSTWSHSPERSQPLHAPTAATAALRPERRRLKTSRLDGKVVDRKPEPMGQGFAGLPDIANSLDWARMEGVAASVGERCVAVAQADDGPAVAAAVQRAGDDLAALGLAAVQLWLFEPGGALASHDASQARVTLGLQSTTDVVAALRDPRASKVSGFPYARIQRDSAAWSDAVAAMTAVAETYRAAMPRGGASPDSVWESIYVLPLALYGVVFVAEAPQEASAALKQRPRYVNAARMRSLFALQCVLQLATAAGERLRYFADASSRANERAARDGAAQRLACAEQLLRTYDVLAAAPRYVNEAKGSTAFFSPFCPACPRTPPAPRPSSVPCTRPQRATWGPASPGCSAPPPCTTPGGSARRRCKPQCASSTARRLTEVETGTARVYWPSKGTTC